MSKIIKILLVLTIIISLVLTVAILIGGTYVLSFKDSRIDSDLLDLNTGTASTEFYYFDYKDRGKGLGYSKRIENTELNSGIKYRYVSYAEMPENLINAFISIEDKRFYNHKGVDLLRSGKATVNYLFGRGNFGGSTITQQLVKNITGHDEFDVKRKMREMFQAINIEKEYTKSEILEMYLNVINLSAGCRGVGAAAEYYFSKTPAQLSLSECAILASITNNPIKYDPRYHPENTMIRKNAVLKCMLDQKLINKSEYDIAMNEPISLNISDATYGNGINSWYIDMVTEDVIEGLCEKYEIDRSSASLMLYRGNLKIYTAIDIQIQAILDMYYANIYNFPADSNNIVPQSAMIVIDPHSGDILGVVGGVGEKRGNRIQNHATQVKRPPGSTLKPLSVYAPALEKKIINWATIVEDSPVAIVNGIPWPNNVTRTYMGPVDISYAIGHSLNTVAVKVLKMLGENSSFEFLHNDLMIHSLDKNNDCGLASLGLGQPTKGISLRELTAAYSIFQNGIMSKPRSYYKVTDQNGRVILDNAPEQQRVISNESASIMTKFLEEVVESGTAAGKISLNKRLSVAGKSGTSQNNYDRLFVGYTPELLAGVWFGYDYPKDLSVFGGNVSVCIWDEVMNLIFENTCYNEKTNFSIASTIQQLSYDKKTGKLATEGMAEENQGIGWFVSEEYHINP